MAQYYYTWTSQDSAQSFPLKSAKDDVLILENGQEIIDLSSLSYQASFGQSCQQILSEMTQQMKQHSLASPKADFKLKTSVTEQLLKLINLKGKIFYTVSGAESIENALKMAREINKRKVVACRQVSYHGASLGALSITGDWRNQAHETVDDWTLRIPEPNQDPDGSLAIKTMEDLGADKIAALCLETITGGNGVFEASQIWWSNLSNYCKEKDIFLILDEVICGFYRTGKPFGFQHYQLEPDFITLSKSLSGGYIPFGAVWTSDKVAQFYEKNVLACGLTNYAHPLGLAATVGVLKIINDNTFKKNLDELIKVFQRSLKELSKLPQVEEIRQVGLLAAIETNSSPDFETFLKNGIYLIKVKNRIMLAPNLNIQPQRLEDSLKKLATILEKQ